MVMVVRITGKSVGYRYLQVLSEQVRGRSLLDSKIKSFVIWQIKLAVSTIG